MNEEEFKLIKNTSKHAYAFLKQRPQTYVFSSLTGIGQKLEASEFNKIFTKRSYLAFSKNLSATEIRKQITTYMKNQNPKIQEAIARAEGHSILIAEKHYNISDPYEIVKMQDLQWKPYVKVKVKF